MSRSAQLPMPFEGEAALPASLPSTTKEQLGELLAQLLLQALGQFEAEQVDQEAPDEPR